jgi:leucyl aminopeptidase
MQIKVESGDISTHSAGCVVVNLFEGVTVPGGGTGAVDAALGGMISELIAAGDIRGKEGELTLLHAPKGGRMQAARVLVAGLGKSGDFTVDKVRTLSANIARFLRGKRAGDYATIAHGAGIGGLDAAACAQAIAEGTLLGLYRFDHLKKPADDASEIESVTIVEHDSAKVAALTAAVERGVILAEAAALSRDLSNEPANILTPTEFAKRAKEMAEAHGLGCKIIEKVQAEEMGMGAFLGVARGSNEPPKFIVLTYAGAPDSTAKTVGLVGKGITFDTGGISIKPSDSMLEMKGDMSGGGAIIAAMMAIARLKPKVNVTALIPATENMPSGNALKPSDVLRAMNGKTIEVVNTDAEGRLILSDALSYAIQLDLSPIVDVATLTGAISIALGNVGFGVFTPHDGLAERLEQAGKAAGEKSWRLPMWPEHKELIKSNIADMKNSGARGAGSIAAAFFLREFVDDRPWAHLDIAGVDFYDAEKGVLTKGASGIPVRTLVALVEDLAVRPLV